MKRTIFLGNIKAEEIKAEYSNENTVVYLIKECLIPAYREYREA